MKIGTISDYITKKTVTFFILQFVFIISILAYISFEDSSIECIKCHSDKDKMAKLGYSQFYMTQDMVEKQSKHPNVKCRDCHLGQGRSKDKNVAHKGMLKALFINEKGESVNRKTISTDALLPQGNDKIREMLPHIKEQNILTPDSDIRNILWHDRDIETFNFDPKIAEKTCGKSGCHPEELKQFKTTIMATNFRQRTMTTWLNPYGPHNCGPSFADLLPSDVLKETGFSFKNTEQIQKEINIPFSKEQAVIKQKFCNVCHTGCLDCHYAPDRQKGVHTFQAKPTSETCGGYGRNTSMCHSGSMQSRRGETYVGGDYSIPIGMEPDVHYKKKIHCVDCHTTGVKGMGDLKRKAICQDCHIEIEEAHNKSIHKKLDCATCHINELRGYQIVVWGPGFVGDKYNPFKKYSLYYGVQKPPILIKDKNGIWIPVKVFPHTIGNIKNSVTSSGEMMYRWKNGETKDLYYIVGTFDIGVNDKHLLWLEIQQASHPFGKGRGCQSCHLDKQITISEWQYTDEQGVDEYFKGGYKISADKEGLRITDMKNFTPIKIMKGYKLQDFASWIFLKDKWSMLGDFSIKADKKTYNKYLTLSNNIEDKIKNLNKKIENKDKKTKKKYIELKSIILHNQDGAIELIKEFEDKISNQLKRQN